MVTSDFSPEVEIRPFRACAMHPAIIIETVRSLRGYGADTTFHMNAFLVSSKIALRLKKVCYKVYSCENCQRQSCSAFIGLTIRAKTISG